MNRVLVTGGAGTIGAAVVRRLLRDPDFEIRVSDQREAPGWMRESCEVRTGDLRVLDADAVVIATNHSEFRGRGVLRAIADSAKRDAVVADPWDTFGAAQVFGYATELVALAPRP